MRRTASPVIMAPFFTGEKSSTFTPPEGELWKNAETADSSAVYLQGQGGSRSNNGVSARETGGRTADS